MQKLVVVNNIKKWHLSVPNLEVVSAQDYLTNPEFIDRNNVRIFNLCRQYRYQTKGYYVSLLAEARGHKVIPSVMTIQDLKAPALVKIISDDLDALIQTNLKKLKSKEFTLSIYFGKNVAKQYDRLSRELYNLFQAPLLRARFSFHKKWILQGIRPISFGEIPAHHMPYVETFAREYFSRKRFPSIKKQNYSYDLAILVNPHEKSPPSDRKALQLFTDAAEDMGFRVELITRDDYSWLGEFDALFIRETTAVNHHTYRFSRRAAAEGLAVIDDPDSILRCTNKVYLSELLTKGKILTPHSLIVHGDNCEMVQQQIGLPCVLKQPDSSFSRGVIKVTTAEQLNAELKRLLETSELIIAQTYNPTEFDWRIGVLDGQPLFACKYYMAKGHWQIYNWTAHKSDVEGGSETLPISQVPLPVIQTALRAATLIGRGFYGVDLKEINGQAYVIEVNDNPSVEAGIEDAVLGEQLYVRVIETLKRRIEERRLLNVR